MSIRRWLARRRLQRMVDAEFTSFRCTDYRRRRAAALKGRKLAEG